MPLLRSLLRSIIILIIFIPAAAALPLAAVSLTRTPIGGQILFWCGPWSASFYTLIVSQVVGFKVWRGAAYVRALRKARGGYLHTIPAATACMFFGLFASYLIEYAVLCLTRTPVLMPVGTYFPVLIAFAWCSRG